MKNFISLRELEQLAKKKLDSTVFNYFRSGANQEITLTDNVEAFKKIKLNPRVLRDVSKINLETKILGKNISMPIGIAPTAMIKLAIEKGERIPALVANELNIPFTLSTLATTKMSEIKNANLNGLKLFQLYIVKNRNLTETLLKQAELNEFDAIVLTVDAPIIGKRESTQKKFKLPPNVRLEILEEIALQNKSTIPNYQDKNFHVINLKNFIHQKLDPSLTWEDIAWLKSITKLPIILKSIQTKEDAQLALKYGVDGVWVSNHGGRQLDSVRASIDVLPEIVSELKDSKIEIYVDGGIRSGIDIFKCLALGAKCVFVGRPVLYSIVVDKDEGLRRMFQILRHELIQTMQLSGVTKIEDINQEYLFKKIQSGHSK